MKMSDLQGRPVSIVEMGPRDGLQNENAQLSAAAKAELVDRLSASGLQRIESGSFVSPKWIPQMANSADVFAAITRRPGVRYSALTPNIQGFERAVEAGADEVAVFAAASEQFSQKNINCSIRDSIQRFTEVCAAATAANIAVRGYVSCAMGCPYQGDVPADDVAMAVRELLALGCYEVSIGDTIGTGTPQHVHEVLSRCLQETSADRLAMHFHDTYGQALANIMAGLQLGLSTIDASVAGLGGCPYANGASGNVATEDVVFMLHGLGMKTGIDLPRLIETSHWVCRQLERHNQSRVSLAGLPVARGN